jgi:hypothetical protein
MIQSVLVANRGEIARRIFRTCRTMGISTVAVFSDPDRHAPFVAEADQAFALGGSTSAESYLRIDRIIDIAQRSGATAVHPGLRVPGRERRVRRSGHRRRADLDRSFPTGHLGHGLQTRFQVAGRRLPECRPWGRWS